MSQVGSQDSSTPDRDAPPDRPSQAHAFADAVVAEPPEANARPGIADLGGAHSPQRYRRTPRVSLIVVLPEHHVVSPERLAESLRVHENQEVDVVVACAGQPTNLSALQRSIGDAQFLLAPAGTSVEDLRELAIRQVPGDIVTLLSGGLLREAGATAEMFMSS
jgi:hypothetical protein